MQDFFNIVGSFGFPVAVASYLLFRFEKKLEMLAQNNTDLCTQIKELKNEVQELKEKVIELNKVIVNLRKRK